MIMFLVSVAFSSPCFISLILFIYLFFTTSVFSRFSFERLWYVPSGGWAVLTRQASCTVSLTYTTRQNRKAMLSPFTSGSTVQAFGLWVSLSLLLPLWPRNTRDCPDQCTSSLLPHSCCSDNQTHIRLYPLVIPRLTFTCDLHTLHYWPRFLFCSIQESTWTLVSNTSKYNFQPYQVLNVT